MNIADIDLDLYLESVEKGKFCFLILFSFSILRTWRLLPRVNTRFGNGFLQKSFRVTVKRKNFDFLNYWVTSSLGMNSPTGIIFRGRKKLWEILSERSKLKFFELWLSLRFTSKRVKGFMFSNPLRKSASWT